MRGGRWHVHSRRAYLALGLQKEKKKEEIRSVDFCLVPGFGFVLVFSF
jgi:hypothetical protein